MNALDVNESKVEQKASLLFYSGAALLMVVLILASYFVILDLLGKERSWQIGPVRIKYPTLSNPLNG